jgi:anion-transporting  ArsA/GET3 family ATPase
MTSTFAARLVRERNVVVCVGAGGVGKTTTAAALGVAAALAGRRALLLTIDPANRLADALGLPQLGGVAASVPLAPLAPSVDGLLHAMRLDTRATFDGLVERVAPSAEAAENIRSNRLYENVASRLSASESYMAVEKLYELATEDPPDLIVLDTPPTRHALDFLEAPQRILDVLNSRVLAILQNPMAALTRGGSYLSQFVLGTILQALERFTGLTLVRDIADFVRAFDGMIEALRDRAQSVDRLLRSEGTAFLLVTAPNTVSVGQTEAFYQTLEKTGVPCAGLIVNRVLPRSLFEVDPTVLEMAAMPELPASLSEKLIRTFEDFHSRAVDEYAAIDELRTRLSLDDRLAEVPAFPGDLASLADVARVAGILVNGNLDDREVFRAGSLSKSPGGGQIS